jgi:hypothetical protein
MNNLPLPLTPPDCDLRDFQFMPLDVVRLRDSDITAVSSGDVFRCAVLLWCASWHQVPAASLPDEDIVLSQFAGFGRVVREWKKVKDGALRGWIKCSDGRLYHPVVAEKANESWQSKLRHHYEKLLDRTRKENKKRESDHQPPIEVMSFDDWISSGMNASFQRKDNQIPPENALKGEVREHKGDILNTVALANNSTETVIPGKVCAELKKLGIIDVNPAHPTLIALCAAGASMEEFIEAGKSTKSRGKKFNYLLATVKGMREDAANAVLVTGKAKVNWRKDDASIMAKARELKVGTQGLDRFQLIAKIESKIAELEGK